LAEGKDTQPIKCSTPTSPTSSLLGTQPYLNNSTSLKEYSKYFCMQ